MTWTPPFTKNKEIEDLIRNLNISFFNTDKQYNTKNLHNDLNDSISLTNSMEIIIKKAEKESIITIMYLEIYWNLCKKHLSITEHYEKVMHNLKTILQGKADDFI